LVQHVDLSLGEVTSNSGAADGAAWDGSSEGNAEADWSIVGTAETWLRLLDGNLNVSAALRRNELRYCDYGESNYFVTEARISLLMDLLGMPALVGSAAATGGRQPAPVR
jgi:hypothetical protein